MSAVGEDGGSDEPSEYSEAILLRRTIYFYHCKSHIRESAVCSVAGAVADVTLIRLPGLPTVSSKSALFMLAVCSLSRTTVKHSSLQPPAFPDSPGVSGHPAVVKWQQNRMSRLKYALFPSWQLIKQLLHFYRQTLYRDSR